MKSWLDTPVAMVPDDNTRLLPTSIVTLLFIRVQKCPVSAQYTYVYTRAAIGETGLKTGGKSAVGTDKATVDAVMDWHIQCSLHQCIVCCSVLQCYDWTNYIILLQLFNPCPSQGGPLIV